VFPHPLRNHHEARLVPESSPIITSNWLAPSNNKWLVPFGAGFGKITRLFETQPLVWQMNAYYNAIHPRDLPTFQTRQLQPGQDR
jgi:hypothetical protein